MIGIARNKKKWALVELTKKIWLTPPIGLVLLLMVACGTNEGPRLGTIQGTVTDERGGPVPGIRVGIVSGTAAFPEIGPATDEEGFYRIGSVPPGTFDVAFHALLGKEDPLRFLNRVGDRIGFDSVTVKDGETSTLDLQIRERRFEVSWTEAIQIIMSGEVRQVTQTHSREVTLDLKDGTTYKAIEPQLDDVFKEIQRCGKLCTDIVLATE